MAFRRAVSAHVLPLVAALALSGCERKVEFQLAPDTRRASEIAAVLSAHGIAVDRKPEKAGVMLLVADSELPRAMTVLREAGLLRASRPSADQALGKRPIAPTPAEEQARRIHGIERDLEATLMDIDGVIAARVRIVPPERPARLRADGAVGIGARQASRGYRPIAVAARHRRTRQERSAGIGGRGRPPRCRHARA